MRRPFRFLTSSKTFSVFGTAAVAMALGGCALNGERQAFQTSAISESTAAVSTSESLAPPAIPARNTQAEAEDSATEMIQATGIVRVSHRKPQAEKVIAPAPSVRANPISFSPAEPRELLDLSPAAVYSYSQEIDDMVPELAESKWQLYPDEYLFDGGDRDYPIHYDGYNRLGVETEDTIAEFTDDEGERHVKATNRVAIFAPRFAAIQSVHGPDARTSIRRLASTQENRITVSLNNRQKHEMHRENIGSKNVRMRSRASGVESEATTREHSGAMKVALQAKLLNAFEEIGFLSTGQFRNGDEARLAYGLQAAAKWSRDQNPVISASVDGLQQTESRFKPQELVGIEIDHKTKGDLRIVKLADKRTAMPGDVITFTLRYDNLGERELLNIKIVDNLTPRLEYIDDSAESDRPGDIVFEDNGEGSMILRFELDEALPGKTGGIITFQCRVR